MPLLLVIMMLFRDRTASILGPELGAFTLIVFAIGITSWMQAARIVRGEVLALKEREYVLAARSIGSASRRIITRHILPNVVSPVMVAATLGIAEAIITESVLSFLGLGFPPDFPTWGRLLYRWPVLYAGLPRAGDLARSCDLVDGAVGELYRRRIARRFGPAHPGALI